MLILKQEGSSSIRWREEHLVLQIWTCTCVLTCGPELSSVYQTSRGGLGPVPSMWTRRWGQEVRPRGDRPVLFPPVFWLQGSACIRETPTAALSSSRGRW